MYRIKICKYTKKYHVNLKVYKKIKEYIFII